MMQRGRSVEGGLPAQGKGYSPVTGSPSKFWLLQFPN